MRARKHQGKWCPIDFTLEVVGGKWTISIIHELFESTKRHTELSNGLGGINPKTLTNRLRLLEKQGIVKRTAYQEIPPRVEYCLTERGKDLSIVVSALKEVGKKWQKSMNIHVDATEQCNHCFPDGAEIHAGRKHELKSTATKTAPAKQNQNSSRRKK